MLELTEMCLEELWELCAGKSSLSCFSQFFSAEPTRLTENKMVWPDFIASHFWEVITAMLLQLVFSQFHACKKVKVTEIIFEGARGRATDREQTTGDPIWSNLVILYQKGGVLRIAVKLVKFCNSTFEGISHLQIIVFTITAFRPQDFSQKRSPGDSSLGITRAISSFLLWYCNRLPLGMKRFAEKRRWSALCRTLVCDHYDFYKKAVCKIIKTCRWTRRNGWHA